MKHLKEVLNISDSEITLNTLIHLNSERKARQNRQNGVVRKTKRSGVLVDQNAHNTPNEMKRRINRAAKNYFEILDSTDSQTCNSMKLKHLYKTLGQLASPIQC